MKVPKMKFAIACAALAAFGLMAADTHAQCSTCAVPQVTYSPVVYNTYTSYDGWYLGKYVGRMGRRIFGTAPAPAYAVGYAPTYSASYAPTYSYASYAPTYSASYAPGCSSCNTCNSCAQTTYRPVIMEPVCGCSTCGSCSSCGTCGTCSSCSGVVQSSYDAPVSSSCPTCSASNYAESSPSSEVAPSLNNGAAPPRTFQDTNRLDPTPATESGTESQALDLSPPLLVDPNDKLTKRPTSPVWTAVYKQPAKITNVSSAKPAKKTIGWSAGN